MEDEFNFDVKRMIDEFDLEKFLAATHSFNWEHGAYLLISDNQLILGYNRDYGRDKHEYAIAHAIRIIRDLDYFDSEKDTFRLDYKTNNEFIKARLLNEELSGRLILFDLYKLESITRNQYILFEYFCDKYNDLVKQISLSSEPIVHYSTNKSQSFTCNDLETVKEYLKTIVDDEKHLEEDQKIIGIDVHDIEKGKTK